MNASEMSHLLYELGEISGETIFIDGTKIEACTNKYTFVWKEAVTKNQEKLLIKIADFIAECEQLYGIQILHGDTVKMKHVKRLRKKLYALKQEENIPFVHGTGKKNPHYKRVSKHWKNIWHSNIKKSLQMPDTKVKRIMYFWSKISKWHLSSRRIMKFQKRETIKMTSTV